MGGVQERLKISAEVGEGAVDGKDEDGQQADEGEGRSSPHRDDMQPTRHEPNQHRTQQVADDVDQQEGRQDVSLLTCAHSASSCAVLSI